MKEIFFKKIKGKINSDPHKMSLLIKRDSDVVIKEKTVIIKCDTLIEHKAFVRFLKQYIFNALEEDSKKREVYMPSSYILQIKDRPDDLDI